MTKMSCAAGADATDELCDDPDICRDPFQSSIDDDEDVPRILIVCQVPDAVFEDQEAQAEFEALFGDFDSSVQFHYLKTFRRARIEFDSANSASYACAQFREFPFMGSTIKCYFAQPSDANKSPKSQYLQPPQPHKQFLISPPGSPPDGWEPVKERAPAINYDLIAAITNLAPGEAHEIQAASTSQPGIVVQVCEDPQNFKKHPKIVPTPAPQALP